MSRWYVKAVLAASDGLRGKMAGSSSQSYSMAGQVKIHISSLVGSPWWRTENS